MSLNLISLNPAQIEAVTAADGPVLIIAGPGTGKTQTLAFRIAYLLEYKSPSTPSILAITFTNKAAQEMKERVLKLIRSPESKVQSQKSDDSRLLTIDSRLNIGTFHALGLTILREQGHRIGLLPDFQILSESDQVEIVKEVLSDIMPKEPLNRAQKWARRLSERKNIIFNNQPRLPLTSGPPEVLISSYENRLKELNLVDFDDLILKPLVLFREVSQVKAKYQNRYHHILVDEYQDINNLQYQFLKEICGFHSHLWVIGDADQAIYAFRGADVEHFFRFQQDNPGVQIINLEKSYRSTRTILTTSLQPALKGYPSVFFRPLTIRPKLVL